MHSSLSRPGIRHWHKMYWASWRVITKQICETTTAMETWSRSLGLPFMVTPPGPTTVPHPRQPAVCFPSMIFVISRTLSSWVHRTFWGWLISTRHATGICPSCCVYPRFVPFDSWVVIHDMDGPCCVYPLTYGRSFLSFLVFGCGKQSCYKWSCTSLHVDISFYFSGINAQEHNCWVIW